MLTTQIDLCTGETKVTFDPAGTSMMESKPLLFASILSELRNQKSESLSGEFKEVIKAEIERLAPTDLPLQKMLTQGSYVSDDPLNATILSVTPSDNSILVKAGIFYSSIIAGCNCADDPSPVDTLPEYCVLEFDISQTSGLSNVKLLNE